MRVEGSNGSVELLENGIVIRRKGLANILTQGIQGDKNIPYSTITAVQFKGAGMFMAGMIQFTILGGREFRGGLMEATKDENAVLFEKKQQADFEKVRDHVQARLGQKDAGSLPHSAGMAEELTKLADLVERGFLTKEEFDARKAALLDGK
jgi:hypothetical protein